MFGVETEAFELVATCITGVIAGLSMRYISDRKHRRAINKPVYFAWGLVAFILSLYVQDLMSLLPIFGFDEEAIDSATTKLTPTGLHISAAILVCNFDRKYVK